MIAAPSANTSGRPSPTLASHVYEDMQGRIPLILDGGAVGIGIESTIIDMSTDTPTILRPGYITKDMLEEVLPKVNIGSGSYRTYYEEECGSESAGNEVPSLCAKGTAYIGRRR